MNPKLCLYLTEEFMVAGVEISRRNLKLFSSSSGFRIPARIFKNEISLPLNEVKNLYSAFGQISSSIPTNLCFANSISESTKNEVREKLKNDGFSLGNVEPHFAELLVNQDIRSQKNSVVDKLYGVIEVLGKEMNCSILQVDKSNVAGLLYFKQFPEFGILPYEYIISRMIVDGINKIQNNLSHEEVVFEYRRHYKKVKEILPDILKIPVESNGIYKAPHLAYTFSTTLARNESQNIPVAISMNEMRSQVFNHIRSLPLSFNDYFLIEKSLQKSYFEKIFIIGDNFNSNEVKKEFEFLGKHRNSFLTDSDVIKVLLELTEPPVSSVKLANADEIISIQRGEIEYEKKEEPLIPKVEEKVEIKIPQNDIPKDDSHDNSGSGFTVEEKTYKEVSTISVMQLLQNQQVRISHPDGIVREFLYLGEMKFKVISSPKSLLVDDILIPVSLKWDVNSQIKLNVERNGVSKGTFQTNLISKLELM